MNLLCKIFGCKFDSVDMFVFETKATALNYKKLKHTLKCKRCGKVFDFTDRIINEIKEPK